MISWFLYRNTIRSLMFLMGVLSARAYAADPALRQELVQAMGGQCPRVVVEVEEGSRCTEGETGCLDSTEEGRKALAAVKKGCEEGRGGPGSPCLYGIFIRKDGKATAVCGPRLLGAKR